MGDSLLRPLDPRLYTDPEVFTKEQQKLFDHHWWLVGRDNELSKKGDYVATTLGRFPIFIVRSAYGQMNGFHNVCRHRAGPIVTKEKGNYSGNLLVCQYHGWCYDLQGRLKNAHRLNKHLNHEDYALIPIRVETWNGLVFACVGNQAPALAHWLGEIIDIAKQFPETSVMNPSSIIEKKGRTNWKVYGDNSCEGYHVGLVHKALGSTMNRDEVVLQCHEEDQFIGFDVTYSGSVSDPSRHGKGLWIYKFPGLLVHFSESAFNAERVLPISEGQIDLKRWFWILSENYAAQEDLVESASRVMEEDLRICESVFKNLGAGVYKGGVLSPEDEPGTVFFQRLVRQLHDSVGV